MVAGALAHPAQHQLDFHPDLHRRRVHVGHLAQEAAAAFKIHYGHDRRLDRRTIQKILGEGEQTAAPRERLLHQAAVMMTRSAHLRDGELQRAALRADRPMQAHVLRLLAPQQDIGNLRTAGVRTPIIALLAVDLIGWILHRRAVLPEPCATAQRAEQEAIGAVAISDRQNQIAGVGAIERLRQQKQRHACAGDSDIARAYIFHACRRNAQSLGRRNVRAPIART